MTQTFRRQWLLIGGSLVTAACLVISPLDEVNETGAISQTGGSAGAGLGGNGGTAGGTGATGGASGSAGAPACTTHADCRDGKSAWRCVSGQCVPIESADCPCVPNLPIEAWSEENSILIAAFAPILASGTDRCDEPISQNYRLAVQEFNDDSVNGLPEANGKPRHIALVICDNRAEFITNNPGSYSVAKQAVMGSMKHLTEDLKVPGILALLDLGMLQEAFTTYAEPNGALFLTPHGPPSSFATGVPDKNNLAWHMLGLPGDVAETYAALVEKIAPIALTAPLVEDGGGVTDAGAPIDASINPLRVAIITTSDAFADELTTAVEAKLMFNGKTWQQNVTAQTAQEFIVAPGAEALSEVVNAIIVMKPHIVLSTGFGASKVMQAAGVMGTKWKPYTVFSPYDISDVDDAAAWIYADSFAINDANWNDHFMWVNVAGSEDLDLLVGYKERYSDLTNSSPVSAENIYDSAYFLIYSLYAANNGVGTATGLEMGQYGMPRLYAASPDFNVGPEYPGDDTLIIPEALKELKTTDGHIRLNGTLGPPFFDSKGIRRNTGEIECLAKAPGKYVLHEHVGHFDQVSNILRFAQNYADGSAQCLQWLDLPLK